MESHLHALVVRSPGDPLEAARRPWHALLAAGIALASLGLGGCAKEVPLRPVPQPEAQPELPPWFPEKPWTEKSTERVFLEGKVVFDLNKSTIRPESAQVLQKLTEYLQANPDVSRVRLEGHTCDLASEEHNQALSVRRAASVADWLVDHGIDHMRLLATAFGESRPLRSNANEAGRHENRRTEFHVAEVGGSPFRGRDPANGGLILEVLSKEERARANEVGKVPTAPEEAPFTPTGDEIGPMEEPEAKSQPGDEPAPAAPPEKDKGAETL